MYIYVDGGSGTIPTIQLSSFQAPPPARFATPEPTPTQPVSLSLSHSLSVFLILNYPGLASGAGGLAVAENVNKVRLCISV
jgi:hypothetical protein